MARMSSAKRAKTEGDAVGGDAARVRGPWILYCTGNAGKFREASFVVDAWNERTFGSAAHPSRARLMQMDPDPTEIQGSADEIARSKVVQAWEQIRADVATPFGSEDDANAERPPDDALANHPERYDFVVTEDVGLGMRCLNGFPGPYCKPMLEAIGPEGLWNLASRYDDKHTTVACVVASLRAKPAPKPAPTATRPPTPPIGSEPRDCSSEPWTARSSVRPAATSSMERRVGTRCSRPRGRTRRSESSSSKSRRRSRIAERRSTPS